MSLAERSKSPDSASLTRREPPILPTPMMPTFRKSPLELVEERPLGYALALLGAHLDVARGQEEDPVGDGLDVAVHRVGEPGAEVHHPAREIPVHVLEVQDDGLLALVAVRQVLRVVEAGGLDNAYAGRALVGDGPEVRGLVLAGVAFGAAGRALAAEKVSEGGAEGGGALGAAEPADRRARFGPRRAGAVGVSVVHVATVLFLFVFVVIVIVHTKTEPSRDPVQTVPNSHRSSLRAHPPLSTS